MPILIVLFTLTTICLVALILSISPGLNSAVREGLWAFTRYLLLCSIGVLGPLLLLLQLTMTIMPYRFFWIAMAIGLGSALLLLFSVAHVRRDFLRRQRIKPLLRRHRPAQQPLRVTARTSRRIDRAASLLQRYQRAQEHLAARRYEDAIVELRNLLEIEPDHAEAHQALGNAYNLMGEPNLALQEFQTAFTIRAKKVTPGE